MSTEETLKNENPFVRVGTTLYKIVSQPQLNGGHIKKRVVWNNSTQEACRMEQQHVTTGLWEELSCYRPQI